MAQSSTLETRLCLVWTTDKPSSEIPRKSSSFLLLDAEWNLQMAYSYPGDQYITLFLYQEAKREKLEKSFRVTTFIENIDHGFTSLGCTRDVQSTYEVIWQFKQEQVSEHFSGCVYSGHWRIVCLFHSDLTTVPQCKNGIIQLSDRNDLDSPNSVDLPPDLESMSVDYSNLLKDKGFSDVKLKCGDRTILAHKAVLAARSNVFADMFRKKVEDSKTDVFDITDLETQTLDLLLNYLYSGKLQGLSEDNVPNLYAVSNKYAVYALKKACSDRMIRNLSEENCVSFLTMANAHSDDALKDAVISFICAHEEVFESDIWLNFSDEHSKLSNRVYQRVFRAKRRKLDTCNGDASTNTPECNNRSSNFE